MREQQKRAGRPRSVETQRAILDAALRLTGEAGYAKLTVEGIAAAAGVGKQTLYRWWRSKADIVLEAFARDARAADPTERSGDWRADLDTFLTQVIKRLSGRSGTIFKSLLAETLLNPDFARAFLDAYLSGRVGELADILRSKPGATDEQVHAVIETVYGAIWYRMATQLPLTPAVASQLAHQAAALMETAPANRGQARLRKMKR